MHRITHLSLMLFALASVVMSTRCHAQLAPCHDSDGDGWADPEFASDSCPPDNCPGAYNSDQINCFNVGDPVYDGAINVLDVVRSVDYAFRGMMPSGGAGCQSVLVGGADVNCDGATSIVDVVKLVNVAFRGGADDFCRPCSCDCYPEYCPELADVINLLPNHGSFEKYCLGSLDGWQFAPFCTALAEGGAPGSGHWAALIGGFQSCGGQLVTSIPNAYPGGVYRVSMHSREAETNCSSGSIVIMQFGTWNTNHFYEAPATWTYHEWVDTLPSDQSGPMTIRIWGNPSQFPCNTLIDGVKLEYLGQP